MYYCIKRAEIVHTKTRQMSFACFVWTDSGALRNNACKQNKVSAVASLMCKSYKLCHLPAFCVEPSNYDIDIWVSYVTKMPRRPLNHQINK